MTKQPQEYLVQGAKTYADKNEDYGDSWRKVGEILHLLANGETVELETAEDHIAYGLYTRRLDKLARSFNGEFLADEMNFESIEDAHSDEMTYASMSASNYDARRQSGGSGDEDREDNSGDGVLSGAAAGLSAATRKISVAAGGGGAGGTDECDCSSDGAGE